MSVYDDKQLTERVDASVEKLAEVSKALAPIRAGRTSAQEVLSSVRGGLSRRTAFVCSVFVASFVSPLQAQEPKKLQGADVTSKLVEIQNYGIDKAAASDYTVDGNQRFDGFFLKADKLIFKKGSKLVFSRQALQTRRVFYVVARQIVMEDNASPGTITWEGATDNSVPNVAGQAGTGNYPGGGGQAGAQGNDGRTGESAPTLYLAVLSTPGSGPIVDLQGLVGGSGGQGQKGGSGGAGGPGDNASQDLFNCRHGAGNGGGGGAGGPGGPGGLPGRGGNGGSFTLLATPDLIAPLSSRVRVLVSGGPAGSPGSGGPGGDGGPGGPGGADARPYCQGSGSQGPSGPPGAQGAAAPADTGARRGTAGDFLVGGMSQDDFKRFLYGGN